MTLIECPDCKHEVDIDRNEIVKVEDGLNLVIKCPHCREWFILEEVAIKRKKLKVAKYGYTIDPKGQKVKIKI